MLNIPRKIRRARQLSGLSQRALGKKVGLTGSEISFLENKKRELTLAVFIDICKALKKHPMYFLHHIFPAKKQELFVTGADGRIMKETVIMLRKHLKKAKSYRMFR